MQDDHHHHSFSLFRRALALLALGSFLYCGAAAAFALNEITLRHTRFDSLKFPASLTKADLVSSVTQFAQDHHGHCFADLGDLSDFMHGHAFVSKVDGAAAPFVLYHTKEYPFLRNGKPYSGDAGDMDPRSERNWMFFLRDWKEFRKGESYPAHPFSLRPFDLERTVTYASLDREQLPHLKDSEEVSFYFFRFECSKLDGLKLSERELELSNLFEVQLKGERICLGFSSFFCRNNPRTSGPCGERVLMSTLDSKI